MEGVVMVAQVGELGLVRPLLGRRRWGYGIWVIEIRIDHIGGG